MVWEEFNQGRYADHLILIVQDGAAAVTTYELRSRFDGRFIETRDFATQNCNPPGAETVTEHSDAFL